MTLLLDAGGRTADGAHPVREGPTCRHTVSVAADVSAGGAPRTLDDLLSETWGGLLAGAPAGCPVCGSAMAPRWSAGAGVVGGRCGNCGSALA
jgi:hypothetical protein